jgi:hypothetical protein
MVAPPVGRRSSPMNTPPGASRRDISPARKKNARSRTIGPPSEKASSFCVKSAMSVERTVLPAWLNW